MLALVARIVASVAVGLVAFFGAHGHTVHPTGADDSIQIQSQTLYRGCNDIVVIAPVGTAWSAILGHVADPTVVAGIWKLDNAAQRYRAEYFSNSAAPLDGDAAVRDTRQGIWFCVSAQTSIS
jgi:hypothetical protein